MVWLKSKSLSEREGRNDHSKLAHINIRKHFLPTCACLSTMHAAVCLTRLAAFAKMLYNYCLFSFQTSLSKCGDIPKKYSSFFSNRVCTHLIIHRIDMFHSHSINFFFPRFCPTFLESSQIEAMVIFKGNSNLDGFSFRSCSR